MFENQVIEDHLLQIWALLDFFVPASLCDFFYDK